MALVLVHPVFLSSCQEPKAIEVVSYAGSYSICLCQVFLCWGKAGGERLGGLLT